MGVRQRADSLPIGVLGDEKALHSRSNVGLRVFSFHARQIEQQRTVLPYLDRTAEVLPWHDHDLDERPLANGDRHSLVVSDSARFTSVRPGHLEISPPFQPQSKGYWVQAEYPYWVHRSRALRLNLQQIEESS